MSGVTTADCELLGRGPVQGSADSDSLAALVKNLCKQQQRGGLPGRRCTVTCSRDAGLEIVPYVRKRPDDEGFESDEDLASLGSYEEPGKRKTGMLAAASVAAGAASDSANSSGVSEDSDDADAASLQEQSVQQGAVDPIGGGGGGREVHGLADVAFCHTDSVALPGIAVWVIKTRRASVAGLEAIVVRSRDNRLQDVCRAYQEHSRRLKLEPKPWTGGGQQVCGSSGGTGAGAPSQRRKVVGGIVASTPSLPEPNCRYNLVQRTDTDGVTHIEVTAAAGPMIASSASPDLRRSARDGPPSSIISISTPESPRPVSKHRENDDRGGGDGDDDDTNDDVSSGSSIENPPQRPERRKHKTKSEVADGEFRLQQKVVRGQFIRVNVNHCATLTAAGSEPERKPTVARPQEPKTTPSSVPATSERLWSTADYDRLDGRYEQHRRSSRTGSRTRSRSSGPGRRQLQPLQLVPSTQLQSSHPPPVAFSRYPSTAEQQPSFGSRFFGKLREITSGNQSTLLQQDLQPVVFRRRNSIGESAAANYYQHYGHHHHHGQYQQQQQQQQQSQQHYYHVQQQQQQQQQQQRQHVAKSGGNLKSVIKKNKSQPYQHAYDEPKKVTFSAYATVQVVD